MESKTLQSSRVHRTLVLKSLQGIYKLATDISESRVESQVPPFKAHFRDVEKLRIDFENSHKLITSSSAGRVDSSKLDAEYEEFFEIYHSLQVLHDDICGTATEKLRAKFQLPQIKLTRKERVEKMGSPQVSSFCGCFGLERGTKIIGYFHTIAAIIVVIYTTYLAVEAKWQIGTIEDFDGTYSKAYRIMSIMAATGSIHIVLGGVLLLGAYKRNTLLLRSWVFIMVFLYVTAIVYIIVVTAVYGSSLSGSEIFVAFLKGTAFFVVAGYAMLCVNSYYLMLKSDEDMCGPRY